MLQVKNGKYQVCVSPGHDSEHSWYWKRDKISVRGSVSFFISESCSENTECARGSVWIYYSAQSFLTVRWVGGEVTGGQTQSMRTTVTPPGFLQVYQVPLEFLMTLIKLWRLINADNRFHFETESLQKCCVSFLQPICALDFLLFTLFYLLFQKAHLVKMLEIYPENLTHEPWMDC